MQGVLGRARVSLHRGFGFVGVALVTSSCSLLFGSDLSDVSDPANPGSPDGSEDAGSIDGRTLDPDGDGGSGVDVDAASRADADAGPRQNACGALLFGTELALPNGDFELGCANGWKSYNATVTEETTLTARGAVACRVCYTSGPYGFHIRTELPINIVPGENYEVVACIRGIPGADTATTPYAEISPSDNAFPGTPALAGTAYTSVRAAWDVTTAYPAIGVDIRAAGVPGACFIVDDVRFSRVRDASPD